MPSTTIHIPETLLREIDRAAKDLGISRNRFVLHACTDALARHAGDWPEGFFDRRLSEPDRRLLERATRELERDVRSLRRNRGAVSL